MDLVRQNPYGETVTYGELARNLGDGTTAQEVGAAVGRNPVCILSLAFNLPGSAWFPASSSWWRPCPRRDGWPGAGSSSREVCRGRVCRVSVRL